MWYLSSLIEPIPPALDHQGGPWNFFVYFLNFNWRLITLQYCGGFLSYIHMNQPWVYMCSPSWPSLPPPSPSHSSRSSQCTSPEHPVLCMKPGWWSISHMIIYMFQCYSLKSSHPHLVPQSPKVCSLHWCLFCCLEYKVIITIFLNSIYMH